MPFTFAHPAIILPLDKLKKRWFSLTGLIAGSMAPDFEYFIRMHIKSTFSHTLGGVFYFDVPLSILVALIFHNLIRNSLFDNLPVGLASRLKPFKLFNWNSYFRARWLAVIISIFIGVLSHLFLDDFTHSQGYFVLQFPLLFNTPVHLLNKSVPVYKLLQHTFTLIGLLYITYFLYQIPQNNYPLKKVDFKYWILTFFIGSAILAVRFLITPDYNEVANIIVSLIASFILALIITPLLIRVINT